MSEALDPREEARRLAGSIAVHLRHHADFRGARYVSGLPMPQLPGREVLAPSSDAPLVPEFVAEAPRPAEPAAQRVALSEPRAAAASHVSAPPPGWDDEPSTIDPRHAPRPAVARPAAPSPPPIAAERPPPPPASPPSAVREDARYWTSAQKLDYLRSKNVGNCQRCPLARTRTNIVFGVGNPEASIMFVGEAPGQEEDLRGEPFVGRAGQRLTEWLGALGLRRDDVYIANVLKCRPPGNRDPEREEVERCSPFLRAQIRAIQPKVLVALGRYAGMLLLGVEERTMRSMRGRTWTYEEPQAGLRVPLIVTYHPSYVLRQERDVPPGKSSEANDAVMTDLRQALAQTRRV
ncbi:MAG TPA: uracil-DNA glycosylase [Nannocystaceae bacterium]|nr:uracil-DNA glycosylase [Nannocystaceae bacterium]